MRVYIVPNDSKLREELSQAGVVIYSKRLPNGKVVDVCDEVYANDSQIKAILKKLEYIDLPSSGGEEND